LNTKVGKLFADTELRKDGSKYIRIYIDLTRDVAELAHGFADVHGDEVGGGLAIEASLGAIQRGGGELEGGVMAGIGDDGFVLDAEVAEHEFDQFVFKSGNAIACEGTDLEYFFLRI